MGSADIADLFAESLIAWLGDHPRLLDVLFILRLEGEAECVDALMASTPVTEVRLAWELHLRTCGKEAVKAAILRGGLQPLIEARHRDALWGLHHGDDHYACRGLGEAP